MTGTVRVFALGGSILAPDRPDVAYAAGFADLILERVGRGERAVVVTGGGGPARHYITAARETGVDEETLDLLGIDATRMNARFLAATLRRRCGPQVSDQVATTIEGAAQLMEDHTVAVMGGTTPGHSTDYVAATVATRIGADHLYVLTNVDGVYSADPNKEPDAEHLPELTTSELLEIIGDRTWTAGRKGVVDPSCAEHVHRHRLPLSVLDGRDLVALRRDLSGTSRAGSLVMPDRGDGA